MCLKFLLLNVFSLFHRLYFLSLLFLCCFLAVAGDSTQNKHQQSNHWAQQPLGNHIFHLYILISYILLRYQSYFKQTNGEFIFICGYIFSTLLVYHFNNFLLSLLTFIAKQYKKRTLSWLCLLLLISQGSMFSCHDKWNLLYIYIYIYIYIYTSWHWGKTYKRNKTNNFCCCYNILIYLW